MQRLPFVFTGHCVKTNGKCQHTHYRRKIRHNKMAWHAGGRDYSHQSMWPLPLILILLRLLNRTIDYKFKAILLMLCVSTYQYRSRDHSIIHEVYLFYPKLTEMWRDWLYNYVPVKTRAYLEAGNDNWLQKAMVDTGRSSSENSSGMGWQMFKVDLQMGERKGGKCPSCVSVWAKNCKTNT